MDTEPEVELCPDCKDLTFLQDGKRHNVVLTPGNRYVSGPEHECKKCVNCQELYANREVHYEKSGHWPDRPICNHVFHHCVTWAEKEAVQERIDYSRRIGDLAALPVLLQNVQWCPDLPKIPAKPVKEGK